MSETFDITDVSVGVKPARLDDGQIGVAIIFAEEDGGLISFKFPLADAIKILDQFHEAVDLAEIQELEDEDEDS